ncbi:MAG: hypothetical protein ABEI07_00060, partial [Candidatus Nanohaloarchaea archaeon]
MEFLEDGKGLAFILVLFILLTSLGSFTAPLEWDEGSFLLNTENMLGTDVNSEPGRPSALSVLVAGIWVFTGESTAAARLLVVFFGAASVLLFHRVAAERLENPLPVTAGYALAPLTVFWSFHVYTDVPALTFLLAGFYLHTRDRPVLSGAAVAASVTFRYVFAVFAASILAYHAWEKRGRAVEYVTGGFLGSIPFLMYSQAFYGGVLEKTRIYVGRVSRWSGSGSSTPNRWNVSRVASSRTSKLVRPTR